MNPTESYQQTVHELFDLQKFAIKLGLHNITALSAYLDNPHLKYPVIHIAGTNGKGSTAFYISRLLQACGLKTGLYTSPHLVDYRERIRVNNHLIDRQYVIDFWQKIKPKVLDLKATFFDTTTLMAFHYFAQQKVDVAVFETGMGGRLDSTNIVKPDCVVITPIGFDHQQHLGKTLKKIAAEKAGIIKAGSDVFTARLQPGILDIIKATMDKTNRLFQLQQSIKSRMISANLEHTRFSLRETDDNEIWDFTLPGPAQYQVKNFTLAFLCFIYFCSRHGIKYSQSALQKKIAESSWPGRLQVMSRNPVIIFDVSHNLPGIKETLRSVLRFTDPGKTHLLLGIVNDKDVSGITKILSGKFKKITVTEPDTYRKQNAEMLVNAFRRYNEKAELIKDLKTAFEKSKQNLHEDETLIALGSHYLIGSLISS